MKTTALIVVAGIAAAASAQGTMTISWTVGDTGNNDGFIENGESALLTMWAHMDPHKTGYAGSIFHVVGLANWDGGTVDSYSNLIDSLGTGPGNLQANNDITTIESLQLPPLFNPLFDASNPIAVYAIQWTPNAYAGQTVLGTSDKHLNFSVYVDDFGSSVEYSGKVNGFGFRVAPAPASLALLGLGGLVAGRRRR